MAVDTTEFIKIHLASQVSYHYVLK